MSKRKVEIIENKVKDPVAQVHLHMYLANSTDHSLEVEGEDVTEEIEGVIGKYNSRSDISEFKDNIILNLAGIVKGLHRKFNPFPHVNEYNSFSLDICLRSFGIDDDYDIVNTHYTIDIKDLQEWLCFNGEVA